MHIVCDESLLDCGGVYIIRNKVNGKIYVGSSHKFRRRFKQHKTELKCNRHPNVKLQRAWEKYGSDAFEIDILEVVIQTSSLDQFEQRWLDELKPYDRNTGYNILSVAKSMLGYKFSEESKARMSAKRRGIPKPPRSEECKQKLRLANLGKKYSEEVRAKVAAAGRGRKHSLETRKKIGDRHRGRKRPEHEVARLRAMGSTEEHRQKISECNAKTYNFIAPDGEAYNFKNLHRFCKQRNLSSSAMVGVNKGELRQHKGWTSPFFQDLQPKPKGKRFLIIDPQGMQYDIYSLSAFCREHGLHPTGMLRVAQGQRKQYKGWNCKYFSTSFASPQPCNPVQLSLFD